MDRPRRRLYSFKGLHTARHASTGRRGRYRRSQDARFVRRDNQLHEAALRAYGPAYGLRQEALFLGGPKSDRGYTDTDIVNNPGLCPQEKRRQSDFLLHMFLLYSALSLL